MPPLNMTEFERDAWSRFFEAAVRGAAADAFPAKVIMNATTIADAGINELRSRAKGPASTKGPVR